MKRELDEQLVKDHPLLFADRHADCRHTCMCWGFPGNGWYGIIKEAADKLEPLIQKFIDDNPNLPCICGCPKNMHLQFTGDTKCTVVFHKPIWNVHYGWYCYPSPKHWWTKVWKRFTVKLSQLKTRLGWWLADNNILYREESCTCKGYRPEAPRAVQVKEKFGTLRFYMSACTEEMNSIASEAEEKSCTVCEECGAIGKTRTDLGWILTLCDTCYIKHLEELERREREYKEFESRQTPSNEVGGDESRTAPSN